MKLGNLDSSLGTERKSFGVSEEGDYLLHYLL